MKQYFIIYILLALLMTGCARTQSGVTSGVFYTKWKDTISANVDNSVEVTKQGEACSVNWFGVYASGDSSVEAAKKNGGIKNVSYADTTYYNLSGAYQRGCTVVKGN